VGNLRNGTKRKAPKNCFWRGDVLWGRTTIAGREYRWSLRTSDGTTARRRVQTEKDRIVAERHFGEQKHKYEDVFVEWSAYIASQVGTETAKRYGVSLKQLEPELLPLFIDEIDKANISDIVKRRQTEGVAIATIRRDLTALSSILEYAEDNDYREGNPALAKLCKLKERRDPIVLPELAHIRRVIDRAPPMVGAMIQAALSTGCRQNELVHAERRNFDYERRTLTVRGKGNKVRTIELDAPTASLLKGLPVNLGCRKLFWVENGKPILWIASRFRDLVADEMAAAQKAAQDVGLKEPDFRRFTFHHLRHRHAVDWLKEGRSIYDLQQRLGHSSITTTEIYLDFLTPEEQRTAKSAPSQYAARDQRLAKGEATTKS
jgi:integrase/recombinase XerD